MANAVTEEGEEDEHGVFAAIRQAVRDGVLSFQAFNEPFILHFVEPAGEHPRREAGIVSKDLPEPIQFQESHVAKDEQRPFSTQTLHAFPNGIRLIRQERSNRAIGLRPAPIPRHYPPSP